MDPQTMIQETTELGDLLVGLAGSVVRAQDELDRRAAQRSTEYVSLPDGVLALPPIWYTVNAAAVELEMSATVEDSQLVCRLLDPLSVAVCGYQASASARVRLLIGPNSIAPIKVEPHA